MDLHQMQQEHRRWADLNFGHYTPQDQVMGMMEELGELSHAIIKHKQGIRGVGDNNMKDLVIDAHCDLIIFSLGLANLLAYDLDVELDRTWGKVSKRDWNSNPETGAKP